MHLVVIFKEQRFPLNFLFLVHGYCYMKFVLPSCIHNPFRCPQNVREEEVLLEEGARRAK